MTQHTFEYKALRFLNDRIELYNITDYSLKIALYDFPENQYIQEIDSLRNIGYIKNKDLYEKGLSITDQGQIRLQQLQKIVDREKKQSKPFWDRVSRTVSIIGVISAISLGWLTWYNAKENTTLKNENKSLKDSIANYLKNESANKNEDSLSRILKP